MNAATGIIERDKYNAFNYTLTPHPWLDKPHVPRPQQELHVEWPFLPQPREAPIHLTGATVVRCTACPDCHRPRIGITFVNGQCDVWHDDGSIAVDDERLHYLSD